LLPPGLQEDAQRIGGLLTKLEEGGSPDVRSRALRDMHAFSSVSLSPVVPAVDFFMRASGIAMWTNKTKDDPCWQAGVEELFSMLRRSDVKKRQPAAG
jgi:hypothetical protein